MAYKKLTVEQWEKLVERFEGSGMEQRAFAAKAGVSFSRLKYWLYKIRREQAEGGGGEVSFVEVKAEPVRNGACIQVDLPSGLRVRFDGSTEAKVVGEVTQALTKC